MKKRAALAIIAMLPTLAYAQSAVPTASDRTAMAVILNQIITLQQQQLIALQQLNQRRPTLDNHQACVYADQVYTEGSTLKASDGKFYLCARASPNDGQDHDRLVWAPQS